MLYEVITQKLSHAIFVELKVGKSLALLRDLGVQAREQALPRRLGPQQTLLIPCPARPQSYNFV